MIEPERAVVRRWGRVVSWGMSVRVPPSPDPLPRSLKWRAYGLVRPIVRPVAWRVRTFFVGHLLDEIGELRAEVRTLREAVERERAVQAVAADERVREVMAQALATLALDRDAGP